MDLTNYVLSLTQDQRPVDRIHKRNWYAAISLVYLDTINDGNLASKDKETLDRFESIYNDFGAARATRLSEMAKKTAAKPDSAKENLLCLQVPFGHVMNKETVHPVMIDKELITNGLK
jgi:hypothetical protein